MQGVQHRSAEGIAEPSDARRMQEVLHDNTAKLQDAAREQQCITSQLKEAVLYMDKKLECMQVLAACMDPHTSA